MNRQMMGEGMSDNEPRMPDRSPEGQIFAIEAEIENMMKEYEMAARNGENERAQMIADRINELDVQKTQMKSMLGESGKTMSNMNRDMMAEGGEAIGDELEGMGMSKEQAMAEVGVAEKEMQMIQQLVAVVQKLIAEGISEKDLIAFLKEQGLDDEDIDGLMQMVLQSQGSQDPEGIDQQIAGMM